MKNIVFAVIILAVAVLAAQRAEAACTVLVENQTVVLNTTAQGQVCGGTYRNTTIDVNGNGMTLNCNSTILVGYGAGNGITVFNNENVTINGCNVSFYLRLIDINQPSYRNVTVTNCTLGNSSDTQLRIGAKDVIVENNVFNIWGGIGIAPYYTNNSMIRNNQIMRKQATDYRFMSQPTDNTIFNMTIENNTFIDSYIYIRQQSDVFVYNNTFNRSSNYSTFNWFNILGAKNINIVDNTVYGGRFYLENITTSRIHGNYIENSYNKSASISLYNSNDTLIDDNTLQLNDKGMLISRSSRNITIEGNNIYNSTSNYDSYNYGIGIEYGNHDVLIENNTILDYGSVGVFVRQSGGVTIKNNAFNQLSDTDKLSRHIYDLYDPNAAIAVLEVFKGWLGDGLEGTNDNITNTSAYRSENVTIIGNTNGAYVQTYLRIQGAINITHDYNGTGWYRRIWFPTYLLDADEFYNSNAYENISIIHRNTDTTPSYTFSRAWMMGGGSSAPYSPYNKFNYTLGKKATSVRNANDNQNMTVIFYNMTVPYYDVYNVSTTSVLARNVSNYSILTIPGQEVRVGDYTVPSLALNNPSIGEHFVGNALTLVFDASDADPAMRVLLDIGGNATVTNGTTYFYAYGGYSGVLYAVDSSGNANSTEVSFFMSTAVGDGVCGGGTQAMIMATQAFLLIAIIAVVVFTFTAVGGVEGVVAGFLGVVMWLIALGVVNDLLRGLLC